MDGCEEEDNGSIHTMWNVPTSILTDEVGHEIIYYFELKTPFNLRITPLWKRDFQE